MHYIAPGMKNVHVFAPLIGLVLTAALFAVAGSVAANDTNDAAVALGNVKAVVSQFLILSQQNKLDSQEAKALVTDEASGQDLSYLRKLAGAPDRIVFLNPTNAVACVQWFRENGFTKDLYMYLVNEGEWKVRAVRGLALTELLEEMVLRAQKVDRLTDNQRKELSQEDRAFLVKDMPILLANVKLTLATDAELRIWFKRSRTALEELAALAASTVTQRSVRVTEDDTTHRTLAEKIKNLHLSGVSLVERGKLELVIGGITDNTVGLIYSPSNTPPQITCSEYIWVEKLDDKWYLFRTT